MAVMMRKFCPGGLVDCHLKGGMGNMKKVGNGLVSSGHQSVGTVEQAKWCETGSGRTNEQHKAASVGIAKAG
jgi:hypothetical protein